METTGDDGRRQAACRSLSTPLGHTPLWFAAQRGQTDSVLKELQRLNDCAQETLKDLEQQTLATDALATHGTHARAAFENDGEIVIDPLFCALQIAIRNDHHATVAAIVKWAFSDAASTNIRTKLESVLHCAHQPPTSLHSGYDSRFYGKHPLGYAAQYDAVQTCAIFLDLRPHRAVRFSALLTAAQCKNLTVANVLLDSLSDQTLSGIERDYVLKLALLPVRHETNKRRLGMLTLQVVRRLLAHSDATPSHKVLREAAQFGNVAICKLVLSAKASLTSVDCDGWTALHHAVVMGQCGFAHVLLRHAHVHSPDANLVNARTRKYNYTALHCAALHCAAAACWTGDATSNEFFRPQEYHYAALRSQDSNYATHRRWLSACSKPNVQQKIRMLQLLLRHKADVNARSDQGHTPIELLVNSKAPTSVVECVRAFLTC